MSLVKNIGKIIRIAREDKKLSQKELADKIGVHHSLISKWELGHRIPDANEFIILAELLDIVPDIFPGYGKTNQPPPARNGVVDNISGLNIEVRMDKLVQAVELMAKDRADVKAILEQLKK